MIKSVHVYLFISPIYKMCMSVLGSKDFPFKPEIFSWYFNEYVKYSTLHDFGNC